MSFSGFVFVMNLMDCWKRLQDVETKAARSDGMLFLSGGIPAPERFVHHLCLSIVLVSYVFLIIFISCWLLLEELETIT